MMDLPKPDALATLAFVLAGLFLLRFLLLVRRLDRWQARENGVREGDYRRFLRKGSFGADLEPERTMAVRQLVMAGLFLAAGLSLFLWLFLTGQPVRFSL
ncbi:hypothetical protein [Consotaella salsifontis]|uniref:Uncharacterized protein n=1 Tax=Consotaella salsifontis TaxID=1365950 RepID=A0A1T4P6U4_9HYPH|nr:hypothetical protein [Consotaella salsifontis]SJZ87121.1 hypothetical protein SAMN05428963_103364 [Consotaella salsifontis]